MVGFLSLTYISKDMIYNFTTVLFAYLISMNYES